MEEISKKFCGICGDEFIPNGRRRARCAKVHYKACSVCNKDFEIKANMKIDVVYCGVKCRGVASKRIPAPCKICGKPVVGLSRTATTCSAACAKILRDLTNKAKERQCTICGELFVGGGTTKSICAGPHYSDCEVCGKIFEVFPASTRSKVSRTCSSKCNGKLVNTPFSDSKRKESSVKNWGTEFPFQSKVVKEKIAKSNIEKYGVSHPMKLEEVKEKARKTCLEKYGTEYSWLADEVKEKTLATNLKKYGVSNPAQSPEVKRKIQASINAKYKSGEMNFPRISQINKRFAKLITDEFPSCNATFEEPYGEFFADLLISGENQRRVLVDINPTVTHNVHKSFACIVKSCTQPCSNHPTIARDYHYRRALAALDKDVTLVQCYEWDCDEVTLRIIGGKIAKVERKFSSRKLSIEVVTSKEANIFLNRHHGQGAVRGQKKIYGLLHEGELLAVASFGKARFKNKAEWEFLRYAVKNGVIIHGGAARLFDVFKEDVSPKSVVSYVDFNHTTKRLTFLDSLGFIEHRPTGPSLTWHRAKDGVTVKETSLLSLGADRLLGTNYGRKEICGMNNEDIMLAEGFLPVYTAGNRVFLWGA